MSAHPMIWYAVFCRPQSEQTTVAALRERKFDVYLPVETRLRRTVKGPKTVFHPLVPSMLFVGVSGWDKLWPIRDVASVHGVVSLNGKPHPIPASFVYHMMACQSAGDFDFRPKREEFQKGQTVKVMGGPFQELIGEIIEATPEGRVTVFLDGKFIKGAVKLAVEQVEHAAKAA